MTRDEEIRKLYQQHRSSLLGRYAADSPIPRQRTDLVAFYEEILDGKRPKPKWAEG